jgi:hypothetical protein
MLALRAERGGEALQALGEDALVAALLREAERLLEQRPRLGGLASAQQLRAPPRRGC